MTIESDEKEECPYCGKEFKKVVQHLPHCPVKKLSDTSKEEIQNLEIKPKSGPEITVPVSNLATVKTDRFWAWTEGMGIQLGSMVHDVSNMAQNTKDIKEWCGNMGTLFKQHLNALNTGMGDTIDLLKEIVKYEKVRALNLDKVRGAIDDLKGEKQSETEMAEEYDEILQQEAQAPKEDFVTADVVSYKNDDSLPDHTRKLKGKILIITEKALQIAFENGKESWIPKSTVKSTTKEDIEITQSFVIDSWVLLKNGVITEEDEA